VSSKYWTKRVEFKGNKVYQQDGIIDPRKIDTKTGKTNLELMKSGKAPKGPDGESVNLHHMIQTKKGGIAEITQEMHQKKTKIIHINPNSMGSGIKRSAFDTWREAYWKNRAKDFM
jgi:filamentous hemagglutinin